MEMELTKLKYTQGEKQEDNYQKGNIIKFNSIIQGSQSSIRCLTSAPRYTHSDFVV